MASSLLSEFSLLDGLGTAKQYAERAVDLGQPALALTDHGSLSGSLHHIEACKKNGVMPISGVEAYFRPNRIEAKTKGQDKSLPKEEAKIWRQFTHMCLYAKDLKGWHSLIRIISASQQEVEKGGGFYGKPCVDYELLEKHREGLVCSTACVSSYLSRSIQRENEAEARAHVTRLQQIFGADLWLEIMPHDFDWQREYNKHIVDIGQEFSIPILATNDAHFPHPEWAETQRLIKMMSTAMSFKKLEKKERERRERDEDDDDRDSDYMAQASPTLYLCSRSDMEKWFGENHPELPEKVIKESLDNTVAMADTISPFFLSKKIKVPKVEERIGDPEKLLRKWIDEGLEELKATYPPEHWGKFPMQDYLDRVEVEWKILADKEVLNYIAMIAEIVRWANANGIRTGLGRGSAAGSLISYLVGIVAIDPIPWNLLFERFINPGRKGMPDIDVDFQSEKRGLVKEHIVECYGEEYVADIITHSTFKPKKVIGDLCRVYDNTISFDEAMKVTGSIEIRQDQEETTLEELVEINDTLAKFRDEYPDIWEHALILEGAVAQKGKHAAGVVITPDPIVEYMALERSKDESLVTSWSDSADFPIVSDYGYMKLDALGIIGLEKHDYACRMIKENHGVEVDLNSLSPLRDPEAADPEVLKGFGSGRTVGVFQFSGAGMTRLIEDINPETTALDLAAANALYRPGPMKGGVTWEYAKRKHGKPFEYWHPIVEPILGNSYGIAAYQEHIMLIAREIGGFSMGEADDLRKAMGKLYRIKGGTAARDYMKQYEEKWFQGCVDQGLTKEDADSIWEKILAFGSYGFNLSHAASYALQAYQDMWLKTYYPAEFYAALLTFEKNEDVIRAALQEAEEWSIEVVFPDINLSQAGYSVDTDGRLILGLSAIKGVGEKSSQKIVDLRESIGGFESFSDIIKHRSKAQIPLKSMLQAGALDSCIGDRAFYLGEVEKVGARKPKDAPEDWEAPRWQVWEHIAHNEIIKNPREVPEAILMPSKNELRTIQSKMMNLPVSPMTLGKEVYEFIEARIDPAADVRAADDGQVMQVAGEIVKYEEKKTKKGDTFAKVDIGFGPNTWSVKFWAPQHKKFIESGMIDTEEGSLIMVRGKKDEWNGFVSVVAQHAANVSDLLES